MSELTEPTMVVAATQAAYCLITAMHGDAKHVAFHPEGINSLLMCGPVTLTATEGGGFTVIQELKPKI